MTQSETIGKLAEALSKAQGVMKNAVKDKENPFFKSSYADLASCWDACREALSINNLSVTQLHSVDQNGKTLVKTLLMHSSGEWVASILPVNPVKQDPQSFGSSITYMRRFGLSSIVGIAPSDDDDADDDDDDDGNRASSNKPPKKEELSKTTATEEQLNVLCTIANQYGLTNAQLRDHSIKAFGVQSSRELTLKQYNQFLVDIESGIIERVTDT